MDNRIAQLNATVMALAIAADHEVSDGPESVGSVLASAARLGVDLDLRMGLIADALDRMQTAVALLEAAQALVTVHVHRQARS
jgi:hypothetical protein